MGAYPGYYGTVSPSINSGSGSLSETSAYRMHDTVWWVIFCGVLFSWFIQQQCCGNYRSEVIDYNYDYFSLKMPNCNFNY